MLCLFNECAYIFSIKSFPPFQLNAEIIEIQHICFKNNPESEVVQRSQNLQIQERSLNLSST